VVFLSLGRPAWQQLLSRWREPRRHFGNHSSRIAAQYMELK
jgi:hypothetical protein